MATKRFPVQDLAEMIQCEDSVVLEDGERLNFIESHKTGMAPGGDQLIEEWDCIFRLGDKFYRVKFQQGSEFYRDSGDDVGPFEHVRGDDIECVEVVPQEVTVTKYVPAP